MQARFKGKVREITLPEQLIIGDAAEAPNKAIPWILWAGAAALLLFGRG